MTHVLIRGTEDESKDAVSLLDVGDVGSDGDNLSSRVASDNGRLARRSPETSDRVLPCEIKQKKERTVSCCSVVDLDPLSSRDRVRRRGAKGRLLRAEG